MSESAYFPITAALNSPGATAAHPHPYLIVGAVLGYLVLMFSNPVRISLRDGLRCIQRYSVLWMTLGLFGSAYALFQVALRAYFHFALQTSDRPEFLWLREGWHDPQLWLIGSPESLWYLPPDAVSNAWHESILPTLENVAGLFNCAFSTFPLSALAALLFLLNVDGHQSVLLRALRKRLGVWSGLAYVGILLCTLAAISKPLLYVAPQLFGLQQNAAAAGLWFQWSPVVEWLAFLFEYLLGVCIQIYLILLAYCWVRGVTVNHRHLLDFAIRRFSLVVRWAAVVMVLSSVFIHLPLILKNFDAFSSVFPSDPEKIESRLLTARSLLTAVFLAFAAMQITLTFHSESLGKAVHDHLQFVKRNAWSFAWFLIIAAMHFFLLELARRVVLIGLGEGTGPGIVWSFIVPWLNAFIVAWLLASWVCFYRHASHARPGDWIKF